MEELVRHQPDILCLQEVVKSKLITFCDPVSSQVDHFPLLERALSSLGYEGHFVSKPDSPCIYLPSNSGPDGCALFYKKDQWEVVGEVQYKTLEVFNITWRCIVYPRPEQFLVVLFDLVSVPKHLYYFSGMACAKQPGCSSCQLASQVNKERGVRGHHSPESQDRSTSCHLEE